MNMTIYELFIVAGIPTAITGVFVWLLKRWIKKQDKKKNAKEDARTEISVAMVAAINAAITLGEATATAISRIPDAHCNGDMHDALEYAKSVKNAQKDLLIRVGIKSINEVNN